MVGLRDWDEHKREIAKNVLSLGNHHRCYIKYCYIMIPKSAHYLTNLVLLSQVTAANVSVIIK